MATKDGTTRRCTMDGAPQLQAGGCRWQAGGCRWQAGGCSVPHGAGALLSAATPGPLPPTATCIECSGVSSMRLPSVGDWKVTPSSVMSARCSSDTICE